MKCLKCNDKETGSVSIKYCKECIKKMAYNDPKNKYVKYFNDSRGRKLRKTDDIWSGGLDMRTTEEIEEDADRWYNILN